MHEICAGNECPNLERLVHGFECRCHVWDPLAPGRLLQDPVNGARGPNLGKMKVYPAPGESRRHRTIRVMLQDTDAVLAMAPPIVSFSHYAEQRASGRKLEAGG